MEAIIKLNVNQLDNQFLKSIRKMFKEKDLIIRISAAVDETAYLTSNEINEKQILNNIAAEPAIKFTAKEFEKYADSLL